jgi:5-formyltetrahydrofolate cyclo-ligase
MTQPPSWQGRDSRKDAVRVAIWSALEAEELGIGPVRSHIPNFVGADTAAAHLARLPAWKAARTIKCNPDPPQIPVRLRALYDGKMLFAPVPYLRKDFPYVRIDPARLARLNVDFELAATAQGFLTYGEPIDFEALPILDFCIVGCVAVGRRGGRIGKGAGFADLEQGIFRELGKVSETTPIATTVHSTQVVEDSRIPMLAHDSALDFIATERELIETRTPYRQPAGVTWTDVRQDQFETIPFLAALRRKIEAGKGQG